MSRDRTAVRVAESRLCAPSDERRGNLLIACSSFVKNAVAERPPHGSVEPQLRLRCTQRQKRRFADADKVPVTIGLWGLIIFVF